MMRMDRETSSKSSVMKKISGLDFEAGDSVSKVLVWRHVKGKS